MRFFMLSALLLCACSEPADTHRDYILVQLDEDTIEEPAEAE